MSLAFNIDLTYNACLLSECPPDGAVQGTFCTLRDGARFTFTIMDRLTTLTLFVILAFVLDFLTGILAAPGVVATMIATRAMSPRKALILSTVATLIGPFLFGLAVANAVGVEVLNVRTVTPIVLYASMISTIVWMVLTYYLRIPSSSSHAMIGGLLGAALAVLGPAVIDAGGLLKMIASLALTMPLGIAGGFLMVRLCYWLSQSASPKVNRRFNQGQLVASFGLGLAIGSNSAQRVMGMMALGLLATGFLPQFEIPTWVIAVSAIGLALGNLLGGMRMINSVGGRFFQIRPIHGFSAETASALIILVTSLLGGVVSTTQVTSLSVVGAGAGERVSMVRWDFVQSVVLTWVLTIPLTAILAAATCGVLKGLGVV